MSTAEKKRQRIENGLIPFMSGEDETQTIEKRTLAERMAYYKLPGVSIAIIDDGRLDWARGYGVIKAGSDTLVTTETFFEAASTTKLLTSVIALYLIEQEHLGLDEDVNTYLETWKIPENAFTRKHKVTLRLLLTHQAGIPSSSFSMEEGSSPSLVQVLKGQAPAQNKAAVVEYVPGSQWQYSNLGYVVIQQLLEDVSGKPFAQIAREIVFDPLGMSSSTLVYPLAAELAAREAVPHDAEGTAYEPAMHPTAQAQGGLMTTPSDLAQFAIELMRAYRGKSNRLLSHEMARRLFDRELDLDPRLLGIPLGEGLGVLLRTRGTSFSFLHPGDNEPGASCWLEGCPDSGKGIVVMTNGAKGNLLAIEILAAAVEEYHWPTDR